MNGKLSQPCTISSHILPCMWHTKSPVAGDIHTHRQSIKKLNLWNSEPASARNTLTMVASFWHSQHHAMSISHRVTRAWMSVCLVLLVIFCTLINKGSWGARHLHRLLFQIGKNFYRDFSDVATGLRRGLFEPYAMSRVVPAFQIRQNVHRRWPQIWMAFHVNGRWSSWECAYCDPSKSLPNCLWGCQRSRNL